MYGLWLMIHMFLYFAVFAGWLAVGMDDGATHLAHPAAHLAVT